jgi:sugar O-acyltransferase (sialic acid O-acetyltransferase NeuD family)
MSSKKIRLAIVGAAELGLLVAHHATNDGGFELVGYYDDFNANGEFNRVPILGKTEQIIGDYGRGVFDQLFVAIGYNHMHVRAALYQKFAPHVPFANIIHSSCYVDSSVKLGTGIFLLPGVTLDMDVEVGNNVLMNTACAIAHHTSIGDHCFLAPSVHLAGRIVVEEKCFIGIGATVVDCIRVGANATVGAASLVLKDVEPNSISFGNPAKHIKYKD